MTPEQFFDKLLHVINQIKTTAVLIIVIVALIVLLKDAFLGNQDRKETFSTVLGLMVMAALIFYADKFIIWLSNFVR